MRVIIATICPRYSSVILASKLFLIIFIGLCGPVELFLVHSNVTHLVGLYSIRGIPLCNQHLLVRGTPYSAIPVVSTAGVHDVYLAEGNINGERFTQFVESCLLPILNPFNGVNQRSVVIMDNASIHHVDTVQDLIE